MNDTLCHEIEYKLVKDKVVEDQNNRGEKLNLREIVIGGNMKIRA